MKKSKKLIIWDFDGVIADTEKLWLKIWNNMVKADNQSIQQRYEFITGVENIMKHHEIKQCIETGGTIKKPKSLL